MTSNKKLGAQGEDIAAKYLAEQGYNIISRNWTHGHKEIDIICLQEEVYIFVEVKTRRSARFGQPESAISSSKIESTTAAATHFLEDKTYKDIRFDVVSIIIPSSGKEVEILHIKDAFY